MRVAMVVDVTAVDVVGVTVEGHGEVAAFARTDETTETVPAARAPLFAAAG